MKILYHHRIASKDGQYVHIEEIIHQFKTQGQDIVMVCPSLADKADFGSSGGLVSTLKKHMPQTLYELLELTYNLVILAKLIRSILKDKPDVIYERYNLFTVAGIWTAKLFRIPLMLEVNAPLYEERTRFSGITLDRLAKSTERYCWQNADQVLPVTEVLAGHIRKQGVSDLRITVIPNGVDTSRFNPDIQLARLPKAAQGLLVLGFVGFCREWHKLDKVVELIADKKYENLFLLIVGDGPAREGITQTAKRVDIEHRVHITGLISREQMPGWLAAIDIALQSAVVDYASPLKMLEYMACGKAIVAPDQPNIKELLRQDENALLFKEGDSQSLLGAISALADSELLRKNIGQQAALDISQRKLTWAHNAERIIRLFEGLLSQRNPAIKSKN